MYFFFYPLFTPLFTFFFYPFAPQDVVDSLLAPHLDNPDLSEEAQAWLDYFLTSYTGSIHPRCGLAICVLHLTFRIFNVFNIFPPLSTKERRQARFPLHMWNQSNNAIQQLPGTNNAQEGWKR